MPTIDLPQHLYDRLLAHAGDRPLIDYLDDIVPGEVDPTVAYQLGRVSLWFKYQNSAQTFTVTSLRRGSRPLQRLNSDAIAHALTIMAQLSILTPVGTTRKGYPQYQLPGTIPLDVEARLLNA